MSEIEKELLTVTKLKAKKNEERPAYLKRLAKAVADIPDADWEGLTTEAQGWYNGAAEEIKGGRDALDFEDKASEEADDPVDLPDEEVEKPAPKRVAAKVNGRKASACHTIKKMVVENPTITVSELSDQLKEAGLKVSDVTIATLRSDLRDTLRVLNEVDGSRYQFSL